MTERFNDQPVQRSTVHATKEIILDLGLRSYMIRVYAYMSLGLGLTGLVAFYVASSPSVLVSIFTSPLKWVVMFAPLAMVFFLSARIATLSLSTAQMVFWIFAGLMGLSLSSIFLVFTGESIARLFFITASIFATMSLYGYTTRKDLTAMGSFLMMGVLGLLIASFVNLFFYSSAMQMMISSIGVLVFTGLTAYDVQQIKESYFDSDTADISGKKAILGALQLYLDFINLFISLLQLSSDRR